MVTSVKPCSSKLWTWLLIVLLTCNETLLQSTFSPDQPMSSLLKDDWLGPITSQLYPSDSQKLSLMGSQEPTILLVDLMSIDVCQLCEPYKYTDYQKTESMVSVQTIISSGYLNYDLLTITFSTGIPSRCQTHVQISSC